MRAIICAILLLTSTIYSQWVKQNPLTPFRSLLSIDFVNTNTGWSAGDSGTIIKTTNGGLNWTYQNLPSRLTLQSVKFINENTGFVCGDSGKILITTNSGNNWQYQTTATDKILNSLWFINQTTGYSTGWGCILKTTNAGQNWFSSYNNENTYLFDIFFINSGTGWATTFQNGIFKTTNGGVNWDTTNVSGLASYPQKIFFINQFTGWVTYHQMVHKIGKTTDGGFSWINYNTELDIYSVYFFDENTGWGTGGGLFKTTNGGQNWVRTGNSYSIQCSSIIFKNQFTGYIAGTISRIIKTTNSGENWINLSPEIQTNLYNVKFLNQNTGFATGTEGTIAKTSNGGINWTRKQPLTIEDLYQISIVDDNVCYITGDNGTIIKTVNNGENWITLNSGLNYNLRGIEFINENTGWVCGDSGTITKTLNGGSSWTPQNTGVNEMIWRILSVNTNKVFALGRYGVFLKSTNGGINWVNLAPNSGHTYIDIFFLNQNTGWITQFGTEKISKTTDGGNTWEIIPTDFTGLSLNDIKFFNENTGYGINYLHYKTTNGGVNWISKEIAPIGSFVSFNFIDLNTGWAVSQFDGQIYKTTNGGLIPVANISTEIPKSFALYQNYPNPFNPLTKIKFSIPYTPLSSIGEWLGVRLVIYDILGKEIAVLVNELLRPGTYEVEWNGSYYTSGVYFYRLETGGPETSSGRQYMETKKMVLIK